MRKQNLSVLVTLFSSSHFSLREEKKKKKISFPDHLGKASFVKQQRSYFQEKLKKMS